MTKKRNIFVPLLLFFLLLTGVRIVWIALQAVPDHPVAVQGRLDLRGWNFASQKPITLDGEWEFYPNALLVPQTGSTPAPGVNRSFIQVPSEWNSALSPSAPASYGFGTYRLRITLDQAPGQAFGIRVTNLPTASALYVNGKLRISSGQPAADQDRYTPRNVPYSMLFTSDGGELEIVIQAANFDNARQGGIIRSVKFGSALAVYNEERFSHNMQLTVIVVLLLHAVYAGLLFMMGNRQKALLYFMLLILSAVLMTAADDDKLLLNWTPIGFEWGVRLLCLSMVAIPWFLLQFLRHLLPKYTVLRGMRRLSALFVLSVMLTLLLPISALTVIGIFIVILFVASCFVFWWLVLRSALEGMKDAVYLLMGITAMANSTVWGVVGTFTDLQIRYYPIDLLACVLAFASFWFKHYIRTAEETEKLAGQLMQENKRKDDFLANTSHELRNPLHGILNIAESVLEREQSILGKKGSEDIRLLISIGRRMSLLLNDLLDRKQLQETGIRLHTGSVQVQAVASGVLDMLRFMTEGKPIRFVHYVPERFPPVLADENRLIQIMFNLLHNAVKFTREGTVTIQAFIRNGQAVVRITDTGIGIDEETQRRIFQPYEQGDSGEAAVGGGIGLGLSICKQLVELQGGELFVSSVPGRGSVFSFTLPLAGRPFDLPESALLPAGTAAEETIVRGSSEPAAAGAMPKPAASSDRPNILAVDDDPVNLAILSEILSAEAYDITTVTGGNEALAMLMTREWDLIIADIMMPHMSGYALTRSVRERFSISELPILLLTARSRPEDVVAGFLSGANDYVMKPMEAMELRARVKALTAMKQSVREQMRIEAACLQAQIQPHFLFNTLNSIAALSEIDTVRMRALLGNFGHYLRASFDFRNLDRLVPVSHEIGLVRSYLFIEKERFEERLEIEWELDEHLRLRLPPLSIQPLVENAVKHGVLAQPQGGKLRIRITDYDSHAEIAVIDNGVGMDESTRTRLLEGEPAPRSGIGLRNTDRRLKQLYGKGLLIESEPGKGTTVTFSVLKQ
ncbi:response regulator [Paenibacillus mesophilus]|uniref:hybrid sensor histidine kinase/response regulator n=1 Tax=Paenibacillus mesophilus TaxID=2582849 RepID=UPI00110D8787|nr:ATP-binding protein [Paenibacillus mesophilus]TMV45030.1 response regulator [Paenibacillus mesophilus]